MSEKSRSSCKNESASHNLFLELNLKPQVWQGSFREYSKQEKTVKNQKFDISDGHIFLCKKKIGVTVQVGNVLKLLYSL